MDENPYKAPQMETGSDSPPPRPRPFPSRALAFVVFAIYLGLPLLGLIITAVLAVIWG